MEKNAVNSTGKAGFPLDISDMLLVFVKLFDIAAQEIR